MSSKYEDELGLIVMDNCIIGYVCKLKNLIYWLIVMDNCKELGNKIDQSIM